ncbi:hypothetical protein O181_031078 [Austropuccinia psidii MF-1]|uniref:Uncharacterized protein n=1 Tax=Austropuccinia psidii MF-1 TaxID=1389203 RepID=A0A9Q3H495_9BASI|nr:hypothetical protein [Austropuccinia psidii MF-1]
MSIPGALAFSIYVDWFNAHGKSTRLASIGSIMLICLNLPPSERLKTENVYVVGIIPGPKEPSFLQLNYLLMPLIKEIKELWQGYLFQPPQQVLQDPLFMLPFPRPLRMWLPCTSLLDLFLIQETTFEIFALFTKPKLKKLILNFTTHAHTKNHKSTIAKSLWASPQQRQTVFSEYRVRYSILEDLPYWDATRMVNLTIMHNLILVSLKDHAAFKLCIPESKSKIYFRSHSKSNDDNSSDSDSMTSNSSLDKITLREAHSLRGDTAKRINE